MPYFVNSIFSRCPLSTMTCDLNWTPSPVSSCKWCAWCRIAYASDIIKVLHAYFIPARQNNTFYLLHCSKEVATSQKISLFSPWQVWQLEYALSTGPDQRLPIRRHQRISLIFILVIKRCLVLQWRINLYFLQNLLQNLLTILILLPQISGKYKPIRMSNPLLPKGD